MFKNYLWLVIIFIVMPIALSAQMHEENILLDMSHFFTTNDHSIDNNREDFFEKKSDLNYYDNRSRDVDTLWTKTFGGTDIEFGYSVQQTTDGGYIIAGNKYPPYGAGDHDIIIIKTDSSGDTLWTNIYGGDGDEAANDIRQTADGGYIITGYVNNGDSDLLLLKTDSAGNIIWSQSYGSTGSERGFSIEPTIDDGYIIAGNTNSYGAGGYDIWLVKTDALGDTLWTKTFGGVIGDYGYCVKQTNDNGYIITGCTKSFGAGIRDVWLIKTDSSGNEQWNQTFGGTENDVGMYVQQTTDDGYIITGRSNSYCAYGGNDLYLIKTDENGNSLWAKTFGGTGYDSAAGYCVQQVIGGYIVAGWLDTDDGIDNNGDVWLIKTNPSGESLWTKTINGNENDSYDIARSIQQTTDGGYIVTGATGIQDENTDIWLLKTDEDLAPGSIAGTVSLNGGTGNVDDVLLIAQPGNFQTNPINADYSLIVQEGDFSITVSLEGYISQIFEDVHVDQGEITNLDITLETVDVNITPDNFYFETTGTTSDVMNLQNQCTIDLDYQISVAFEGDDEIHYDGENETAFGLNEGGTFIVAVRFTAEELASYYGSFNLTGINIFIYDDCSITDVTLKVWEGGSYGNSGAVVYSEDITADIIAGEWKNHLLTSSIPLISDNEYWIGYSISHSELGTPVGIDAGPMVAGKGGWIYFMDQWHEMANLGLDHNLNIRALVSNPWLTCDPVSGVIPSNGDVDIDLMVDATELDFGDYFADITVKILPDHATYTIPVHLLKAIILDPPQNLFVDELGYATWETPIDDRLDRTDIKTEIKAITNDDTRDLIGYNVYLDGSYVEFTTDLFYQFNGLVNGTAYIAGVSAVYDEGESEIIELEFTFVLDPPQNLDVECIEDHAHFTWEAPVADMRDGKRNIKISEESTRDLTGYNVYLDQIEVATNIPDMEYDFYDLIYGNYYDAGVKAIYDEGTSELVEINFQYTGTGTGNILPLITELTGNYPNPFNPETTISFSITQNSDFVTLEVFNLKGQKVKTLINEKLPAGNHQVIWDGKNENNKSVSSGIYFYKMNSNNYTSIKKMILMK